jgi:hypothetical protein
MRLRSWRDLCETSDRRFFRSVALELLPPTIADAESLALLGEILRLKPTLAETSALRLRLFARNFSWQALVDLADAHGVLMPCVLALKQRSLLLPLPRAGRGTSDNSQENVEDDAHVTSRLEAAYAQHLARREALRSELVAAVTALNGAGIVPLVIKGARYLTADCPPWSEARGMRDIDILVPRARGADAVAALRAAGYVAAAGETPTDHHLPEMRRGEDSFTVEPHIEALGFAARKLLPTDLLWGVSVPGQLASYRLSVLPPAWHMLHAALHHQVSDRGYARHVLAIKDVWEFAQLTDGLAAADWQAIMDHMRRAGAADMLGSFLAQAEMLFAAAFPAGVMPSPAARAHARATLRRAQSPAWLRRTLFVADKLRFAFAGETLAVRYPRSPAGPLGATARHVGFLFRLHGGDAMRRMIGRRDRAS